MTLEPRVAYREPMAIQLSVIIPCHNRVRLISRLFESYRVQTLHRDRYEILLIDDGSTDGTAEAIEQAIDRSGINARLLRQERRGPAAARNAGLDAATGRTVYFAGDDFVPEADNLAIHAAFHETNADRRALLGRTVCPREWLDDRFFRFLANRGLIYDERLYYEIADPERCPWTYFHTNNLSMPRDWLDLERFDEGFDEPCLEDTELGFRLRGHGLVIRLEPAARGLHLHTYDWDSQVRSMERIGRMTVRMLRKHPAYAAEAIIFERTHVISFFEALSHAVRQLNNRTLPLETWWAYRLGRAFFRGFHRAVTDPEERLELFRHLESTGTLTTEH